MSLEPYASSPGIVCTTNERKQWKSRKRQGKKKITFLYLIKDVCSSSESCLEWMKEMGFIPRVMFCPNCSKKMKFQLQENLIDGYLWICSEKACEKDWIRFCVRHGTWFDSTDISLIEILLLTYLWIHGFSECQVMKELNMDKETYFEWNSKFSRICEDAYKRTSTDEQIESGKTKKTLDLSNPTNGNPYVMLWLQKNKARDLFIEFLKDADSSHSLNKVVLCKHM